MSIMNGNMKRLFEQDSICICGAKLIFPCLFRLFQGFLLSSSPQFTIDQSCWRSAFCQDGGARKKWCTSQVQIASLTHFASTTLLSAATTHASPADPLVGYGVAAAVQIIVGTPLHTLKTFQSVMASVQRTWIVLLLPYGRFHILKKTNPKVRFIYLSSDYLGFVLFNVVNCVQFVRYFFPILSSFSMLSNFV